jgi:CRISPR-associated protein Cas2
MLIVVSYDVSTTTGAGRKRLKLFSRACSGFGFRVQFSVFECEVDPAQWTQLRARLLDLIEPDEDSLRFYHLGSNWQKRVEHHGVAKAPDHRGTLEI